MVTPFCYHIFLSSSHSQFSRFSSADRHSSTVSVGKVLPCNFLICKCFFSQRDAIRFVFACSKPSRKRIQIGKVAKLCVTKIVSNNFACETMYVQECECERLRARSNLCDKVMCEIICKNATWEGVTHKKVMSDVTTRSVVVGGCCLGGWWSVIHSWLENLAPTRFPWMEWSSLTSRYCESDSEVYYPTKTLSCRKNRSSVLAQKVAKIGFAVPMDG